MNPNAKCKVQPDGSVCLEDILASFNSPIKEEHAWALCYQCARFFDDCLQNRKNNLYTISEVSHVYLQTDGNVHENTIKSRTPPRKLLKNERDVLGGLGIIIYRALDQSSEAGEERVIGLDLEHLVSDLFSGWPQDHHETDDEGIERDSEEAEASKLNHISLKEVIKRCENHLGNLPKAQNEAHYKAVVRALVAEALELSTFLEKIAQGSLLKTSPSNLEQLNFSDWAKFWVQVMGELRMGVKLKKVHYSKAPIEYELTPYEILMKDIRNCRYNLRKIMINGNTPSRVTKDAHEIILEFIRSRPPLKKVSDRKIPPNPKILTPREQLLNSIKKGRKLKPTPRSIEQAIEPTPSSPTKEPQSAGRRLIKVDFSQFEDDDSPLDSPDSTSEPGLWSSEYLQNLPICDSTLDAYDLATQNLAKTINTRRHTLEVCQAQQGCYSVPQSRPCSRQSCNSSEADSVQLEPEIAKQIQDELTNIKHWQDTISLDDRLSLTLSEIVHIRAVLTKAELEALPVEGKIRHDVESRKVCFLCLKTRFGILGPWGQKCTLCKRTVCSKCYCKMNIPMEHFSSVPVVLLSPSIMCSPNDEDGVTFPKVFHKLRSTDVSNSVDSSPDISRPSSSMEASTISDPGTFLGINRNRKNRLVDKFKPPQFIVCHDCKLMVLQIIKSARANRSAIRNKTLQNLTLNLSPVF